MFEAMSIKDLRFARQVEYRFLSRSSKPQQESVTVDGPEALSLSRRTI